MKTFDSGNPLPPNLYRPGIFTKKGEVFRYRNPLTGKFKNFVFTNESEIVSFVLEANETFTLSKTIAKSSSVHSPSTFAYWMENFISETIKEKKGYITAASLTTRTGSLRKNFDVLYSTPIKTLSVERLYSIWKELPFHVQKALRSYLLNFVIYLKHNGVRTALTENPFVRVDNGGFKYAQEPKKIRSIMTMDAYEKIKEVAAKKGFHFLVDAMEISFITYFRSADVLSLRFDDINDNVLTKEISKTKKRKDKMQANRYPLDHHPQLLAIITRAKIRRGFVSDCPFIIHHEFSRKVRSEKKLHRSQVTKDYLVRCMNICLDEISLFKNVPQAERPSFHEIRALRLSQDRAKRDIKEISKDMSHADTAITLRNYDTHNTTEIHTVLYSPART